MGDVGAEADGGDFSALEPAGRLDRMLIHEVPPYGLSLLLSEDFREVKVAAIIGERSDHDLRGRPAGRFAPSADLVEAQSADGGQDGSTGLEQIVGAEGA